MEVRIAEVELAFNNEARRSLWIVETKEIGDDLHQDEDPIHWVLLTTHPTHSMEQAQQI